MTWHDVLNKQGIFNESKSHQNGPVKFQLINYSIFFQTIKIKYNLKANPTCFRLHKAIIHAITMIVLTTRCSWYGLPFDWIDLHVTCPFQLANLVYSTLHFTNFVLHCCIKIALLPNTWMLEWMPAVLSSSPSRAVATAKCEIPCFSKNLDTLTLPWPYALALTTAIISEIRK